MAIELLLTDLELGSKPIEDLNLTEVFRLDLQKENPELDGLDIAVVVVLLFAVFLVGIYASLCANDNNFVRRFMPQGILDYVDKSKNKGIGAVRAGIDSENPSFDKDKKPNEGDVDHVEGDVEGNSYGGQAYIADADMSGEDNAATDFFLANKSMSWWFVGTSLFASNIGSEHFVGQSGDGARRGLPVAMYEWYAALLLIMLGWLFAPVYRRSGIFTTPEFLEKRFGPGSRHYLSFITCVIYVVAKLSASIYGGSLILATTLKWDLYLSAGVCILLSCVYTISGGLRAVMFTDFFQTFIFVGGGFIVMAITLNYVGGYSGLADRLQAQGKGDFLQLWRPASDPEYPITGMLFGQPFTSIWYWCLDQDLVQRVLSAKDDANQKAGCTMAAVLKILPPFIMIIPGIAVSTLYQFQYTQEGAEGYLPEFDDYLRTDEAYPVILTQLMPSGMRGVMIASIMTAMMSSLDSVFNAGSTIVSNDIYRVWKPNASAKELTYVGRVATVLFAVLSFAWIPVILNGDGLYRVVVEIQGYLGPPVGVISVIAITMPRVNAWGSLLGLVVGGGMGGIRLIVNVVLKDSVNPEDLGFFFTVPFLHFSIIIAASTFLISLVVSYSTAPPTEDMDRFMVQWRDIFKIHEDSKHYSSTYQTVVNASGVFVIIATFSIWIIFI
jgi:SSS family solute:Na+ symporter